MADEWVRAERARRLTWAVLALGLLAVLACNLPGQLSYDSVVQLADARSGRYHTWHPAVMAWLLGLGDAVLPGTALYVTAVATLIFAALAAMIWNEPRVSRAAPVAALLICASPLMLLEQGIVWKDVLFADVCVAALLLLFVAATPERSARAGRGLMAGAAALLSLAFLVRQNGGIITVFGAGAMGLIAWRSHASEPLRARLSRTATIGGGALLAMLLCAVLANAALMTRRASDDVGAGGQLRLLMIYDLVGVARRAPQVDLSAIHPIGLDTHIRAALPLYTPLQNDPVSGEPGIDAAVSDGAPGLQKAWIGAILHHPGAWLAHRLDVFRWIYAPPDVTRCTATYAGVDGPPEVMEQLGLKSAWRAQDLRLSHYAQAFVHTPLYSHAFWSVVAVALIAVFVLSGGTPALVLATMLAGALAYAASFLVLGIACDHRYLYVLDLAAMTGLLHLAADWRSVWARLQALRTKGAIGGAAKPAVATKAPLRKPGLP